MCNPYVALVFGALIGGMLGSSLRGSAANYDPSPHLLTLESGTQYREEILGSDRPVLLALGSANCPHCVRMKPGLHETADEYAGRALVAEAKVGDLPGVARRHGVRVVPTVLVFQEGKVVQKKVGYQSPKQLVELLDPLVQDMPEVLPTDLAAEPGLPAGE